MRSCAFAPLRAKSHALANAAPAISNALMQPPFAIAIVSAGPRRTRPKTRTRRPRAACSARPLQRGSRRCWRKPSQTSAAPSSANVHAVERALSASGTASVANPTASTANDSPSTRRRSRRIRSQPSSAYTAASTSAEYASGMRSPSSSAACSANAISGLPNTSVPSTRSRRVGVALARIQDRYREIDREEDDQKRFCAGEQCGLVAQHAPRRADHAGERKTEQIERAPRLSARRSRRSRDSAARSTRTARHDCRCRSRSGSAPRNRR